MVEELPVLRMYQLPRRREKSVSDDSHLPKGDCRYILLHPEVKGLRCACVGFSLNQSTPGSTCDCGHQACYHVAEKEVDLVDRQELNALKQKISLLEEELNRERYGGRDGLVDRIGQLEEVVDRSKAENETEVKALYRGISSLWHNVGVLNKRARYYDDQIEGLADDVQRMQNRLIEVDDASMHLEDRVEALEDTTPVASTRGRQRRRASTPPTRDLDTISDCATSREEPLPLPQVDPRLHLQLIMPVEPSRIRSSSEATNTSESKAWTVHISLLPTSSQPFPFEKDTTAYKRCLSRGLLRVVVIPDTDSHSFVTSVSEAFADVLRGRKWAPLEARLCEAEIVRGLPMLRQLPDHLIDCDYDVDFLKNNCAMVDANGKIADLYIAMLSDTLSWEELRRSPPYLPGLEESWAYGPLLDGPLLKDDSLDSDGQIQDAGASGKRPAAGDILPTWSPSSTRPSSTRLKRTSSEISRTASFGSSAEGEGSRAKMRRQCTAASVEVVGRRVKTA